MFISIVISSYLSNSYLYRCLNSLFNQGECKLACSEIIVSDEGKITSPPALIRRRFPEVKWVDGPGCGLAASRNFGAHHAEGDWLSFLDPLCVPERDYLESVARSICLHPTVRIIKAEAFGFSLFPAKENLIIHRQLFRSLKGFDELNNAPGVLKSSQTIDLEKIPVLLDSGIRLRSNHPVK